MQWKTNQLFSFETIEQKKESRAKKMQQNPTFHMLTCGESTFCLTLCKVKMKEMARTMVHRLFSVSFISYFVQTPFRCALLCFSNGTILVRIFAKAPTFAHDCWCGSFNFQQTMFISVFSIFLPLRQLLRYYRFFEQLTCVHHTVWLKKCITDKGHCESSTKTTMLSKCSSQ